MHKTLFHVADKNIVPKTSMSQAQNRGTGHIMIGRILCTFLHSYLSSNYFNIIFLLPDINHKFSHLSPLPNNMRFLIFFFLKGKFFSHGIP
jgi:hypothetical protein